VKTSTDAAVLVLDFADGGRVVCPPHEEYEAWQVVGGSPENLVIGVGPGNVAVFDERNAVPLAELRGHDPGGAERLDERVDTFGLPRPTEFPPLDAEDR
jgi:hypothetical protein